MSKGAELIYVVDVHAGRFTSVPTVALRDTELSWKAKGLLCYLLSHDPKRFRLTRKMLTSVFQKDGEAAVRTGLLELEEHGYLHRERLREGNTGSFTSSRWTLDGEGESKWYKDADGKPTSTPSEQEAQEGKVQELFPDDPNAAPKDPDIKTRELLEAVIDEFHAMVLAARPADVFGKHYKRPAVIEKRIKAMRARIKEKNFLENWKDAINRIGKIDGLQGKVPDKNGRRFFSDIDWFLRPDTVTVVLEGKYDSWQKEPERPKQKAYGSGI